MCQYTVLPRSLSSSRVFSVDPAPVTSLWYFLHSIPDPRRAQGKRHSLSVILLLAILAICCNHQSYEAMEEWADNYQEIIREKLPFLASHMPDASTFHRVFARLDVEALEQALSQWVLTIASPSPGEGISLDGKSVGVTGLHLVAAFAHIMRSVLFQKGTTTKGKELVIGPEVLKHIPVRNHVVTGDALFAQRDICEDISKRGGGYVFTVKGNQETLQGDIREFFTHPPFGVTIGKAATLERVKGRIEERTIETSTELADYLSWPGLTHVWRCRREITRKGKTSTEFAVGIARLLTEESPAEQQIAPLVRGHWQIENRLHRQRDVVFGEDSSTIRKRNAPQVMAALRNLVLTIFHRAAVRSFPTAFRRFSAHPEDLFSLLGLPPIAVRYA